MDLLTLLATFSIIGTSIGVSLGGAFNELIGDIVNGIITPIFSYIFGSRSLSNFTVNVGGIDLNLGKPLNSLVDLTIVVGIIVFILKYPLKPIVDEVVNIKNRNNQLSEQMLVKLDTLNKQLSTPQPAM